MGTRGLLFCLALCLVLVSIYSRSVFENMKDLKEKTNFGKHFPRQGLVLLCWLLSQGKIDQNGKLRLNFNPAQKLFGFHQYKNYDHNFPDLSNTNFEYFSLGNLFLKKAQKQLPGYIIGNIGTSRDHPENNIDRVVIRVQKDNPTVVDEVYITQHAEDFNLGSAYVKELTHLISKQLLKIIEELCRPDGDGSDRKHDEEDPDHQTFQHIKSMFPNHPHLHWFLYLAGYDANNNVNEHAKSNAPARSKHSQSDNIKLELISTLNGQARIMWNGIPDEMLKGEVKIGVYKDEDEDNPLVEYPLNGRASGEIDTHLALNQGFQLHLLKPITVFETVCESPEFEDGETEMDDVVFREPVGKSYSFFSFSNLFSLVFCPFSNLFSLVFCPFSNLFSLVSLIFSQLFSLVCLTFSTLFLLVFFIFSNLFSLVYVTVSNLFSLLLFICQAIFIAIGKLITLAFYIFFRLNMILLCIILIEIVGRVIDERPRAAPPFVVVSHGRPGF